MASPSTPQRLRLDTGWRFHLGDIPFPVLKTHGDSYMNAKAGFATGAAAPDFDDTDWRMLDLPHDWVVEGPFDPEANLSQGFRPRGVGWYRRQLRLEAEDQGTHLELHFDGVATHCTVWFNGTLVHRNFCGYTGFSIDITPLATYGDQQNSIVVRVDANPMEGWWYEGGGIYRHTWLTKRQAVHIVTDGIHAHPVADAAGRWRLPVTATLGNDGHEPVDVTVSATLYDPAGQPVISGTTTATVPVLDQAEAAMELTVADPQLWLVDTPTLYRVHTEVYCGDARVDEAWTTCGFRTVRFDADRGFFLNDQPLKLQGTCNHQDHAGVGVALPDALIDFRIRRLKALGCNAYRCAHNPPTPELLDACDRHGILVMDENRHFNCAPEYVRQLEWLVRRDRNHPSVILWSVFNEEPMQGSAVGYEMVRRMAAVVRRLDATRPVTAAMNGGFNTPVNVSQAVDVVGFNYQIEPYDQFHAANPTLPVTSSEDTSAFMTRGAYHTDPERCVFDSYDENPAPWGATHRDAWKAIAERPYMAGGFVWTGFDYRGEPTPHVWPVVGSFFGIMDLCGFPKAAYYIHQAQWIKDRPVLEIVPHWNWPGQEGQPVKVMAITNAERLALTLNGRSLGEKPVDRYAMVTWEVPYEAGRLEAVAFTGGSAVATATVETTGAPAALRLEPDRDALAGDGEDALPVTVSAVDAQGRLVPTANLPVEFTLQGPGAIIGLGNGDPTCHEPEKGNRHSMFNGLAQVIIQAQQASGEIVLQAGADGLAPATCRLPVRAADARPSVPAVTPVFWLPLWRMSPVFATRPDPHQQVADSDMNSWTYVDPNNGIFIPAGEYALVRCTVTPFAAMQRNGGTLHFAALAGTVEIWLDGQLLAERTTVEPQPLDLPFPAGEGERTLVVLVGGTDQGKAGFHGTVRVV